jgi:hypothetical protein
MNKNEASKLKIGDTVVITQHGKNKGKKGIVREIHGSTAYLEPFECEFEFVNDSSWRLHSREGLYGYNTVSINYPKEPSNKEFQVALMYKNDEISWSTDNFTSNELKIIDRFLKEVDEHIKDEELPIAYIKLKGEK